MPNPFGDPNTDRAFGQNLGISGARKPPKVVDEAVAWWIDGTDISTLYQDTLRTIPVTDNGQTIEAISDKGPNGWHLDEERIMAPMVWKPTFLEVGIGGFHGIAFDRSFNGNEGQMLRTTRDDIFIGRPWCWLGIFDWVPPGFGSDGLIIHSPSETITGEIADGFRIEGADGDARQDTSVNGIMAAYTINYADGTAVVSVSNLADRDLGDDATFNMFPNERIGFGGNANGAASTGGWHGSISEQVIWQGSGIAGGIPSPDALESYVTGKYGIVWV